MRILVLGSPDGWHVQQLVAAGERLGHTLLPVPFKPIMGSVGFTSPGQLRVGTVDVDDFDGVLVRHIPPGSLEQIVVRMDLLQSIASRGVPVLNPPKTIETCVDKYLSLVRLEQNGFAVPRTVVCDDLDSAFFAFESLGRDVIVKPIFGSEGRGMVRVDDPSIAYRVFRALLAAGSVLYLQERIRHAGFDVRALVVGKRIVAAMKRHAGDDFRTNIACGGRAESYELDPSEREDVLDAAAAVGAEIAGVDFITGESVSNGGDASKRYILEVNSTPGFQGLASTTTVDIPAIIVTFLAERFASIRVANRAT